MLSNFFTPTVFLRLSQKLAHRCMCRYAQNWNRYS